jgi:hypothetical protein
MAGGVQTAAKHITEGSKMTIWMPMCWSPLSLIASFNVNKNIIIIYVLFIWSIKY